MRPPPPARNCGDEFDPGVSPNFRVVAFGEMDEVGKQNLASFASSVCDGCLFEFMRVEDRIYFIRKKGSNARPSPDVACSINGKPRNIINQRSQSLS
jgi:hypothetical protein